MQNPTHNTSQTINLILAAIIGFLVALLLSDHYQLFQYLADADFVELSRRAGLASIYIFGMMLFIGFVSALMYCMYKMFTDEPKPNQEPTIQNEDPQALTMPKGKSDWINVSD